MSREMLRERGQEMAARLGQPATGVEVPGLQDFISEVAVARNVNDNGARKGLYDLLPKKPNRPR